MRFTDLATLAATNLWRRRLRTGLTILGVVIGTACIIIMVALGRSGLEQTREYYEGLNLETIEVYAEGGMNTGGGMMSSSSGNSGLNDNTLKVFQGIDGVEAVSGVISIPLYVKIGKYEADLYAEAMDADVLKKLSFREGELFSDSSIPQLVLGADILTYFQDPSNPVDYYGDAYGMYGGAVMEETTEEEIMGPDIDWLNEQVYITMGDSYTLDPENFEGEEAPPDSKTYKGGISGLVKSSAYGSEAYTTYISMEAAKKMIKENKKMAEQAGITAGNYQTAKVVAEDSNKVSGIVDSLRSMGYEVYSPVEAIEEMEKEVQRQQSQLLLIAAISLFVSAIGIANTMLTSIMERRSEIGVMKVVGMKISKINQMFLLEAGIIGLAGGLVGVALSFILVFVLNNSVAEGGVFLGMYLGENVHIGIPIWLILFATGIAILTGVIAGFYPAWKATKMSPLEAIRGSL